MKFYTTIVIAIVLFGLCFLERKAKQKLVMKKMLRKEAAAASIADQTAYTVSNPIRKQNRSSIADSLSLVAERPVQLLVDFSTHGTVFSGR